MMGRGKARKPKVRQIATWAKFYGVAERTVKRWRARAKLNGDPVNLDDPEEVRQWWLRNMEHRVPDQILTAVVSRTTPQEPEPVAVNRRNLGDWLPFDTAEVVGAGDPMSSPLPQQPPKTMLETSDSTDAIQSSPIPTVAPVVHHDPEEPAPVIHHDPEEPAPVIDKRSAPDSEAVASNGAGDGSTWRGVALHPFTSSRCGLFAQQRLSMGAPPLERCLADLDGFQTDAYRILWLCSNEPAAWSSLRTQPATMQQVIDDWSDEETDSSLAVEAVFLAYKIYAASRSTATA